MSITAENFIPNEAKVEAEKVYFQSDVKNLVEKEEIEEVVYTEFEHRFQYLLGIALFFLLLDSIIPERKSKWSDSFNLFKINQ